MAKYSFTTHWQIPAPLEDVWSAIVDVQAWPDWWPGVEEVTLLRKGDAVGIGAIHRYVWKSRLPYRLSFDMETIEVEPCKLLAGRATGELAGSGRWTFAEKNGTSSVRYDWNVRTTQAWMNWLAPLARPLFAWNHNVVMAWGRDGMIRLLATNERSPRQDSRSYEMSGQ